MSNMRQLIDLVENVLRFPHRAANLNVPNEPVSFKQLNRGRYATIRMANGNFRLIDNMTREKSCYLLPSDDAAFLLRHHGTDDDLIDTWNEYARSILDEH